MINSTRAFIQSVIDESPFLSSIKYRPWYYLNEFWTDNADPEVAEQFPFMQLGAPWGWALFCLTLVYFIRVWGPKMMTDRKPFQLRPYVLVVNGFLLGSYTTAVLTSASLTSMYTASFDCSTYNRRSTNLIEIMLKHCAFLSPLMRILEFNVPVFRVLMKKRPITNLHLANLVAMTLACVSLVKINPGGFAAPIAAADAAYHMVVYYYLIFQSASCEFHHSTQFKQIIYFARMATTAVYVLMFAIFLLQGECGNPILKIAGIAYGMSVMVLFPYDWFTTEQIRLEKQAGDNEQSFSLGSIEQAAYEAFLSGQTNITGDTNTITGDTTTVPKTLRNNSINNNGSSGYGFEHENRRRRSSSIIYKASN